MAAHGRGDGRLEIAVLPTFSTEWLIPRLTSFYAQHPQIRVNMGVRAEPFSFEQEHFEAAIHHGRPLWPRATCELLFGENMVPVARQDLIGNRIQTAADLLNFPLLHCTARPDSWKQWFEAAGLPRDSTPVHAVGFELHCMCIRAAASGLGIALVPEFFVRDSAWQAGVVRAHPLCLRSEDAYYLVYPNDLRHSAPLEAFREWILAEARLFEQAGMIPDRMRPGL